jgi:hypothetical protein
MDRHLKCDDLAGVGPGAAVPLLSDASSYTTGSLMTIDGGVSG